MSEYLADYHLHSRWSLDARYPMAEMVEAAVAAGLSEICFTDHVEIMNSGSSVKNRFDWAALEDEYRQAAACAAGRIVLRRGLELGEAVRDINYSQQLLDEMLPVDFIIGSQHQLSHRYSDLDLAFVSSPSPAIAKEQIEDYLEQVLKLARWGHFSVLGHLTLPLRYMNEGRGLHMTFDGYESEVAEIFRALIENGCGIELNTNRGHDPLPGEKWLRLYRSLGGEIITLGSDAHSPRYVGCRIRECQGLLRKCGFTRFTTFQTLQPVFHAL